MKVVIMAGGEGSRLRPLTEHCPKPMLPIGEVPALEHLVRHLVSLGLCEIVITISYLPDVIREYFGDGSRFEASISYSLELTPLGTAGGVRSAEELIGKGTFLVVSGDAFTNCDFVQARQFHAEHGLEATMIVASEDDTTEFGVVSIGNGGVVERFCEKGTVRGSSLVNTGMYLFDTTVLDLVEPGVVCDWSLDVLPKLVQEGRLVGFEMQEYWCDIGSLDRYHRAQADFVAGKVFAV